MFRHVLYEKGGKQLPAKGKIKIGIGKIQEKNCVNAGKDFNGEKSRFWLGYALIRAMSMEIFITHFLHVF